MGMRVAGGEGVRSRTGGTRAKGVEKKRKKEKEKKKGPPPSFVL